MTSYNLGVTASFSKRPGHKFMTANRRVILRVRRYFTAHQFGANSDCCEYKYACRLAEGKQIAVSFNTYIMYVVLVMARSSSSFIQLIVRKLQLKFP
jgi:hypothetical protein